MGVIDCKKKNSRSAIASAPPPPPPWIASPVKFLMQRGRKAHLKYKHTKKKFPRVRCCVAYFWGDTAVVDDGSPALLHRPAALSGSGLSPPTVVGPLEVIIYIMEIRGGMYEGS